VGFLGGSQHILQVPGKLIGSRKNRPNRPGVREIRLCWCATTNISDQGHTTAIRILG